MQEIYDYCKYELQSTDIESKKEAYSNVMMKIQRYCDRQGLELNSSDIDFE